MKNLLYKDFRLVVVWPVYLMLFMLALMAFTPGFPPAIALGYIAIIYPMIFIGANKGTQTNDMYFSLLLPVSRKKIVLGRMLTIGIFQLIAVIILSAFHPLAATFFAGVKSAPEAAGIVPDELILYGPESFMAHLGFGLVGLSVLDLGFFSLFYRSARNLTIPYVVGTLTSIAFETLLGVIFPIFWPAFRAFFGHWDPLIQGVTLAVSLVLYFLLHWLTYVLAARNFRKADF